jgi:LysM repeat protein
VTLSPRPPSPDLGRFHRLWWLPIVLAVAGCAISPSGSNSTARSAKAADVGPAETDSQPWPGDLASDDPTSDDPSAQPRYHKARAGESIADIASIYGMTVPELLRFNHGLDPADGLKPGETIYVPRQK